MSVLPDTGWVIFKWFIPVVCAIIRITIDIR